MKVVVLAGGSGTRLFPLSRKCYPKQFLKIAGKESLLAQTIKRFLNIVPAKDIVVITNETYKFLVKQVLEEINAIDASIILEPIGRNTAPAIALAIKFCQEKLSSAKDEVVFVTPSDHVIEPYSQFAKLVTKAECIASSGNIVTLGVVPSNPETGYGYICAGDKLQMGAYKVAAFKEKPTRELAVAYLRNGNYYWNAGMFIFSQKLMIEELYKYQPDIMALLEKGYQNALKNFSDMPNISIDYAVAEKSDKMVVLPMDIYWSDVGSWDALRETMESDVEDNIINGDVNLLDCNDTLALSTSRMVIGIGLKDTTIVETPDVVLISKKGDSQKVKKVFEKLQLEKRKETIENTTMYRPWGSYTILNEGEMYKVKRLVVNPKQKLSLQLHHKRSEHWTVVQGEAIVTIADKKQVLRANESIYISMMTKHRLENVTDKPVIIVEVQVGSYLGEDDIERFDDKYGRSITQNIEQNK